MRSFLLNKFAGVVLFSNLTTYWLNNKFALFFKHISLSSNTTYIKLSGLEFIVKGFHKGLIKLILADQALKCLTFVSLQIQLMCVLIHR